MNVGVFKPMYQYVVLVYFFIPTKRCEIIVYILSIQVCNLHTYPVRFKCVYTVRVWVMSHAYSQILMGKDLNTLSKDSDLP